MSDDLSCGITTTGFIIYTARNINVDIRKGENENEKAETEKGSPEVVAQHRPSPPSSA